MTILHLAATAGVAATDVPAPMVEGPVTGGLGTPFIISTTFDLATVGYRADEYFISGTASAYLPVEPLTPDGRWTLAPGDTAAYKTRILVYRPIKKRKFNGTVVVEWLNVSRGADGSPEWTNGHVELIREGFAWVGVSAHHGGVDGGGLVLPGLVPRPLKVADPERYGSLIHPGDSFSYDIFSQAGQAVRGASGTGPLADLEVKAVIAVGESQSAYPLLSYINGIQPITGTYDGFLLHSRGSASLSPLSQSPQPAVGVPPSTLVRADIDVPVMTFETETDMVWAATGPFVSARQDDSDRFRLWEIAGTADADTYLTQTGLTDLGKAPAIADLLLTTSTPLGTCPTPVNSGPQHLVLNAAIHALNRWVRRGTPPPGAPRLEVVTSPAPAIVRDAHGNALGGVRTPQVDVPIATLSGEGQTGGAFACALLGTTVPFDAATLSALYPSHRAFVSAFSAATGRAVRAGFLLKRDAKLLRAWARTSAQAP